MSLRVPSDIPEWDVGVLEWEGQVSGSTIAPVRAMGDHMPDEAPLAI